jgi:uncharacterized protein (TIGR03000 family)
VKRHLLCITLPTLVLLCFLSLPADSDARGAGGGGRGGGGGGYGRGGYGGGYGRGYGGYGGGYGRGYGGFGYGGLGLYGLGGYGGYGGGYGGYAGGYGGYGGGGYYSPYNYSAPYYATPAYGAANNSGIASAAYQSAYPPSMTAMDTSRAYIHVHVPANAQVLFDNTATEQTGPERTFMSPPLEGNQNYSYQITAKWMENGKDQQQTRTVRLVRGQNVNVDFTPAQGNQPHLLPQPAQFQQPNQATPKTPTPARTPTP